MRIVIDTNVIASAIFFGGKPEQLVEMLMQRDLVAFVSKEILQEYQATVDELAAKYPQRKVLVPLTHIAGACKIIETTSDIHICRDPDDDKFIECAVDSRSIYIVSGDKDLLDIKQYQNVKIVTVADFFKNYLQR